MTYRSPDTVAEPNLDSVTFRGRRYISYGGNNGRVHEQNPGYYGSGVTRPKIDGNAHFELKGKFLKELHDSTFSGSDLEDERGFGSLPSSMETNPRDHVKSILTAKADSTEIRRIGSGPYAVSDSQFSNIFSEPFQTIPFSRRLHNYCFDKREEAHELMILETYSIGTTLRDNTLLQKRKGPRKFHSTLFYS
ncbi:hypothetical protein Tco_1226919 [Tanacetum coccineum]